ncbi:MAG: AAA family ATPase [Polyangiaceae bacterium]|nr:AAA family ATPase [Polyangiaceae bacterium]
MKIRKLCIKNICGLPDMDVNLTDRSGQPFDVVLFTGPMGCGKTRLLEAIAAWKEIAGSYGTKVGGTFLPRDPKQPAVIEGTWHVSSNEITFGALSDANIQVAVDIFERKALSDVPTGLRKVLSAFERTNTVGKVEYFPASRQIYSGPLPVPIHAVSEKLDASLRLTKDPEKYGLERAWLTSELASDLSTMTTSLEERGIVLPGQVIDSLTHFKRSFARLAPHLRLSGLSSVGEKSAPTFVRSDRTSVLIDELSSGEQQAVLFAATFERLGLSNSLLLIDSPELFISAGEQMRFFQTLTRLGQDNQVIGATSSTAIVNQVPAEQVVELGAIQPR